MKRLIAFLYVLTLMITPSWGQQPRRFPENITIYVTDFGFRHWKSDLKMFDDFMQVQAESVVPDLDRDAEILIPMPFDGDLPKTESDERDLIAQIADGIIRRIDQGNCNVYEVRIVQNINLKGNNDPFRQGKVKDFASFSIERLPL